MLRPLCAAATLLSALALMATPAAAASPGLLTLFSAPNFTGPTNNVSYTSCDNFVGRVPGQRVGSFDNRPLPGCRVVLHALTGDFTLCAGRGVVPPASRQVNLYSIRAGASAPCPG
ncbi:hypothetical protein SAMN05444920_102890 [Nonomuraea solani]|uniref:Uncharacterized protein n=1 Tax=Nonomuraea solani TaxID=1144553 RepID=A0A1H5ZUT2_9ACTN|nr:hypothetical protein [Nonomuraea solani]SEG40248.1 hypothetical protein SAMN05444920_102890 [Nonomuraea solani]